jgi:hypothetical protein
VNLIRPPAIRVCTLATKCGDLYVHTGSTLYDDYAKMSANELRLRKVANNLVRQSIGTDVEVFRKDAEKAVPDTTSDEISLMARAPQLTDDIESQALTGATEI